MTETYFETLGSAIDAVATMLVKHEAVLAEPELFLSTFEVGYHMQREESRRHTFDLATFKGRPTRKAAHMSLYRMPSGRYELTTYIA